MVALNTPPTDARDLDVADVESARACEARAEAALMEHPLAESKVRGILGTKPEKTRGPRQEAMRKAARELRADAASQAFAEADAAYWRVVTRHDTAIRRQAAALVRSKAWGVDKDEAAQLVRVGWYRAAIRWDPSRGLKFPTYAADRGMVELQRANDREADVASGQSKELRDLGGWTRIKSVSMDAPLTADGDFTIGDTLAVDGDAEAGVLGGVDAARLRAAIQRLPDRQRVVIARRYFDPGGERTLLEVAPEIGVSRERVRQIEASAVGALRKILEDDMTDRRAWTVVAEEAKEQRRKASLEGHERAKARGVRIGRPPKATPQLEAAVARVAKGEPLRVVAREEGVDRNTLKRRLDAPPDPAPAAPPAPVVAPCAWPECPRTSSRGRWCKTCQNRLQTLREMGAIPHGPPTEALIPLLPAAWEKRMSTPTAPVLTLQAQSADTLARVVEALGLAPGASAGEILGTIRSLTAAPRPAVFDEDDLRRRVAMLDEAAAIRARALA